MKQIIEDFSWVKFSKKGEQSQILGGFEIDSGSRGMSKTIE